MTAPVTTENGRGAGPGLRQRWIVLVEAEPKGRAAQIDARTASSVLRAMGGEGAVGLRSPGRVAMQVSVHAADAAVALSTVLSRWRSPAVRLAMRGWAVVRAEVLTWEEFQLDVEVG